MLNFDQKRQFNEILDVTGANLDITKAQYDAAVTSYQFVGGWLSHQDSPLAPYKPEIQPQGSFLLGTMVPPIHSEDDLDVDLVCRLEGKLPSWTQADLKKIVGDRLKAHGTIKRMLDEEGRRCWTVLHRESARFHLDVLPAIVAADFKILLEKAMSATDMGQVAELAIRITDKLMPNYRSENEPNLWLKSNPFGYAVWFKVRSVVGQFKSFTLNEAIQPVPAYQEKKAPLQRLVQILKRHRDIMFNGNEDKPISIIITTLAALAYKGESDLSEALINVVSSMDQFIEDRHDYNVRRTIKWIPNPVNKEENFADKWVMEPNKQRNFYKWLQQLKADVMDMFGQRGLANIKVILSRMLGEDPVTKAFSAIGDSALETRESGALRMAASTGILGQHGRTNVPYHNNFGKDE